MVQSKSVSGAEPVKQARLLPLECGKLLAAILPHVSHVTPEAEASNIAEDRDLHRRLALA